MKRFNHRFRKGLALLLTLAMAAGLIPAVPDGANEVQAAAGNGMGSMPSVSAYATKEQMMDDTFAPNENEEEANYGKLVFGKNSSGTPQEWYILGKDSGVSGDNTIIFAASPIIPKSTGQKFEVDWLNNKTYDTSFGVYTSNPTDVYPNHYGASDLRVKLQGMATNADYFTTDEQGLMNDTTVTTKDIRNDVNYTTTDKLYALAAGDTDLNIKAGTRDQTVLAMNRYWNCVDEDKLYFWLRSPLNSSTQNDHMYGYAHYARSGHAVGDVPVNDSLAVQPASNLNLSSVLFASNATAASSETVEADRRDDEPMTLRFDGTGKDIGAVTYNSTTGDIKATKGSTTGDVALVVQGKEGRNWYYSKQITGTETVKVNTSEIKDKLVLADINLSDCKIWLETTDSTDKMIYAVCATEILSITSVAITGIETPAVNTTFDTEASCVTEGVSSTTPQITWTPNDSIAGYNTSYTASLTLTASTGYEFIDSTTATVLDNNATSVTKNTDGTTLTVTYAFPATAKRKITGVTAPTVPANHTFETYYGYEGYDATPISTSEGSTELGTTATVTLEGTVEPATKAMDVTWTIESAGGVYDKKLGAENTFRWIIPASALTNYDAAGCQGYDATTGTITGTVTITNKDATPVTITGTDKSVTYTGATIDVSQCFAIDPHAGAAYYSMVLGEGEGTGGGWLLSPTLTVFKTGTFIIKVYTEPNGIYASGEKTITLTVGNGTIDYTATDYSGIYDGQEHSISVNVTNPAGTTITYSTDGTNYDSTNPAFKDAGTYTVHYRITKENYDTVTGSKTVTISKKDLTASVSAEDKVYDGNVTATVTATVDTGIAGETLTISGLTGSFDSRDAGTNKTVTVYTASVNVQAGEADTRATNYNITYPLTATASISQLTAQLSWGDSAFTYNGNEQAPVATVSNPVSGDACTVTVTGGQTAANAAGAVYTAQATGLSNSNYKLPDSGTTKEFTIKNASQTAPSLTGVNETIKGKADGKITGLTTAMEYRIATQSAFTTVTDAQMTFAAGTYEVRYAAKPNYDASPVATVTISEGRMLTISLPLAEEQICYTLTAGKTLLAWKEGTTLTLTLKGGCTKLAHFAVKAEYTDSGSSAGSVDIADNGNDTYTISGVTGDVKVTVEGVADVTAPTAEIQIGENSWKQFWNTVTFGHFFKNTRTVTITASDNATEKPAIWYLLSDTELTEAQVKSDDVSWTKYEAAFDIKANSKKIIYAKATDEAGNSTIVNSAGIVVYTDSAQKDTEVVYTRLSGEDKNFAVVLNGNTIDKVTVKSDDNYSVTQPVKGTDYVIADNQITLKNSYLGTLAAGNYTITISYHPMGESYRNSFDTSGNDTNEAPETTTVTLRVAKIAGTVSVTKNPGKTYDGTPVSPDYVRNNAAGDVLIAYKAKDAKDDAYNTNAPKNVGDYIMRITVKADAAGNYTEAVTTEAFSILQKDLTLDVTVADKQYDGLAVAKLENTPVLSGVIGTDEVSLVNGTPAFTSVAVGKNIPVSFADFSITGADAANYHLIQPTGVTANIYNSYDAVLDTDYTVNSNDWMNTDFVVTAKTGYELSMTNTADGTWSSTLTATDETAEGNLVFYVRNQKTGAISNPVSESYKIDKTLPATQIKVGTSSWNQFWNKVSFGQFYKNTKTVTITASDNVTANPVIWYLLSDTELTEAQVKSDEVSWTDYKAAFNIDANSKKIIYAKATDEVGNTIVVNSDGIVVYTDSAADMKEVTYVKNVTGDVAAKVKLNGNTVSAIQNGSSTLVSGTDYTVDETGKITFRETYLKTLSAGNYTLTVSYAPMGESYVQKNENEAPDTTALVLTVKNPKLLSITQPAAITGVQNGTEKTAAALGLPKTVTIATEDTGITTADVTWDLTSLAGGIYDPSVLTEQSFTVKGTATLPQGVDNPDDVSLDVAVRVTVSAAENTTKDDVPFIKDDNGKEGWDVILGEVKKSKNKDKVIVDMNGASIVPGNVLDEIKGKDITIVLDMGNGITWSINGQSITTGNVGNIDFTVKTGTKSIPVDIINNVTGERSNIQISLNHSGDFGFTAVLSVNVDKKNAGLYANLFYYNATTGKMDFICADKIADDGIAEINFTHASDYAIVIDTEPMDGNAPDTGDKTPVVWLFIISIISGTGVILTTKKGRKNLKALEK